MPVIIVGTEKNFAALRPRLFRGRVSTAAVKETTDALAAANPHVDLEALQPGTILTVPDLPHVKVEGDVSLDDTTKQRLGLAFPYLAITLVPRLGARLPRPGRWMDTTKQLLEGLANAGASALEDLMATARKTESAAAAERKQLSAALARPELDAAAKRDKALGEDLKAIKQAVDEEEKQAKERAAALDEARSDWNKELKALKGLLP